MERKLELKDIAGYLLYGLKARYDYGEGQIGILKIIGINCIEVLEEYNGKIILRPLSDLYHTIIHNGKEIVPIMDLVKIAMPMYEWKLAGKTAESKNREFKYRNDSFYCFHTEAHEFGRIDNQYQLFDYLNELKIDYRGLIDVGLAIDANTLKNNPYK